MQNLGVDQIMTPRPSISEFPPFTPAASNNSVAACEDVGLPPELCVKCSHGYKVCNVKCYLDKFHSEGSRPNFRNCFS